MRLSRLVLTVSLLAVLSCAGREILPSVPSNTWTQIDRVERGARRASSFRFVPSGGYFLQWGFLGFVTEYYGNPDTPYEDNPEYDIVTFDPAECRWINQFPFEKQDEWSHVLPPMHLCGYYQGITTGSRRPQLVEREGVLRPDLNIVFDQLAYDSRRDRMVFFTGGRTFIYDIGKRRWSAGDGGEMPPPVLGGSLCYDPEGDRIILFGGGHVAEPGPDGRPVGYTGTWAYACESGAWTRLETGGNQPPPRMCTRMVYDNANRAMVVFGGDHQSSYLADTWLLDLATDSWRQSSARVTPAPRAGHFTVYDPVSGRVLIGGGYNREDLSDMWAYDAPADSWTLLAGQVPTGWYVAADIDPERRLIILTTSTEHPDEDLGCNEIYPVRTTYAFKINDQGLEAESQPDASSGGEMLKRPLEEATAGTEPDPQRRAAQLERLKNLPVNQWIKLDNPGRVAPIRTWGSCAFDTDRGRIIYWGGGHCGYGGNDYDFYDVEQNTWISSPAVVEYPERAWDRGINPAGVTFSGAPWIRHGRKIYAYDPVSRLVINTKFVLLPAGYEPEPLRAVEPVSSDLGSGEEFTSSSYAKWPTWSYDPDSGEWNIVCGGRPGLDLTVSTPRGVMAVDHNWGAVNTHDRPDLTVFEGDTVVDNSVYLLDVAGRKWDKLTQDGPWPQNLYEMTALVYDSRREKVYLHGGGLSRDELWEFELKNGYWKKLDPEGVKAPECRREAEYIPGQDVIFTCSYPPDNPGDPAVYVYPPAENRWLSAEIPPPPGLDPGTIVAQNRSITYDPVHNLILMVLGEQAGDLAQAVVYALRYDHRRAKLIAE